MTQGEADYMNQPPEGPMNTSLNGAGRAQRDTPMIYIPTDPPLCDNCQKLELSFFDPNCLGVFHRLGFICYDTDKAWKAVVSG